MLHGEAVALNCGRGAIMYIAELREIRRIWLPDFMCDSVRRAFDRAGVEVETYKVGCDFLPVYDFDVSSGEWMFLADYYGQLPPSAVERAMRLFGHRVIVDETQGFFKSPWDGCDTVYSCRKWLGVSDGAFAAMWDGSTLARELPRDESYTRMGFVLGRLERSAGEFYGEASKNNEYFDTEPIKAMSRVTENLLRGVDYGRVAHRREANWDILHARLGNLNRLHPARPKGPFMYPLFVEDGTSLRSRLIEGGVFVPTLWPNVLSDAPEGSIAHRLARNIVPLPIDQRYGENEMNYIADEVAKCLG